jgi:hypothetical protein
MTAINVRRHRLARADLIYALMAVPEIDSLRSIVNYELSEKSGTASR